MVLTKRYCNTSALRFADISVVNNAGKFTIAPGILSSMKPKGLPEKFASPEPCSSENQSMTTQGTCACKLP